MNHGPKKATVVEVLAYQDGQRIDNFLATHLKGVPKSRVYKAIRRGEVRVNGGRVKVSQRVQAGQLVRVPPIRLAEKKTLMPPSERWVEKLRTQIILETDAVLCISKPAGMPVHAGTGIERGLIENIKASPLFSPQWELVHRLDRETSGLLVLAKQGPVLKQLHDVFRSRELKKGYLLWVKGAWQGGERLIDAPLLRTEGGNGERRVVVDPTGQVARTRFIPKRVLADKSLLWAIPETGRTHQIRVHAVAAGHPILGDKKYGDIVANQMVAKLFSERLMLHSASICFYEELSQYSVCSIPDPIWYKLQLFD